MRDETTKRVPMLSDEQIERLAFLTPPKENIYRFGSAAIRDYYEDLITTGKLLTKEQAEAMAQAAVDRYIDEQGL